MCAASYSVLVVTPLSPPPEAEDKLRDIRSITDAALSYLGADEFLTELTFPPNLPCKITKVHISPSGFERTFPVQSLQKLAALSCKDTPGTRAGAHANVQQPPGSKGDGAGRARARVGAGPVLVTRTRAPRGPMRGAVSAMFAPPLLLSPDLVARRLIVLRAARDASLAQARWPWPRPRLQISVT